MSRFIFFALSLLVLPSFASAQPGKSHVLTDQNRRFDAMTRADTAALSRLLHDDLIYIHSNALIEDKAQHLAAIAAKRLVYQKMAPEKAKVRRYGKTALTSGTVQVKDLLNDKPFELNLAYTAVYRKKRGIWRLLNWQSTRLP